MMCTKHSMGEVRNECIVLVRIPHGRGCVRNWGIVRRLKMQVFEK